MEFRLPKPRWLLRRRAAALLAQMQGGHSPEVERKLKKWCDADPRHAAAFQRVRKSYEEAGIFRHSAMAALPQLEPAARKSEWKPLPALAAAVAIVVLVPVGIVLVRGGGSPFRATEAVMLMTSVGEIREFDLADGSKVTLDTATKVDVEIGRSHRSAHLRYGRARFEVAQARVPFVIETASSTASTSSGVIDVEQIDQKGRIQVLAGNAEVSGTEQEHTSHIAINAGEGLTMSSGGAEQKNALKPAPDWTRGMLEFDGTPLADAVALANRYSDRHIIVAGDLTSLRVTGAFRAGDTAGLAKALAAAFRLSLRVAPDGNLVLSPGRPSAHQRQ